MVNEILSFDEHQKSQALFRISSDVIYINAIARKHRNFIITCVDSIKLLISRITTELSLLQGLTIVDHLIRVMIPL